MTRVVLDTNIIVSGMLWSGVPHKIVALAEQKDLQIITSRARIDEFNEVLGRQKFSKRLEKIGKTPQQIVEKYLELAEIIAPAKSVPVVQEDPDATAILACGIGGKANFILTENDHLLHLAIYENTYLWDVDRFLRNLSYF